MMFEDTIREVSFVRVLGKPYADVFKINVCTAL
jgi:hypothetical protein